MRQKITLKNLLVTGFVSAAFILPAVSAQAQIIVRDNDVEDAVEEAEREIVRVIEEHDRVRTEFEDGKTSDYYTDAIERLDAVIDAMSHIESETRDDAIFTNLATQDEARTAILSISEGSGSTFGLASLTPDSGNLNDYLKRYGYLKPEELYPTTDSNGNPVTTNSALRNQLIDEQKALYYADALVGEVDAARQARYDAYEELSQKASVSDDIHKALDINNALLIENGRNLALLIHLQTAQLNNQSAQLRTQTRERETVSNIFGLRGTGPDS
ncbi:MAG: hypothetical protein ABJG88_02480 [Litorimonas sp.]